MSRYHIGTIFWRIMRTATVCMLALGLFSSPSFAEFSDEEVYDVILEVKHDRRALSQAMFGLEKDGRYYIPLQDIARIVKFKIDVSLEDETAQGFYLAEDNTFAINAKNGRYSIRDENFEFSSDEVIVFKQDLGIGDIYVTPKLLNKIWPLELKVDSLKQVLEIQTTRKLPYEVLQARSRKRTNRLNRTNRDSHLNLDLPKIHNTYKAFSLPALDFSATTEIGSAVGGIGQNVNIRGRHDLLYAQADYNFSFDKDPGNEVRFENSRFLLERKSYDEGDMPLGLQLAQLGDIRPRPSRLIDGSLRGRGILLSTEPQKQLRDFDQITVEGFAEPGWEVELYRGSELVGFQIVDAQGEYRFENITIDYTSTVIKTILYGPEGQIREEEQVYDISQSMIKPGKTIVEASLLELNRDLILSNTTPRTAPDGFAQNFRIKRGVNSWLSAFATFTGMPTPDEDRNYVSVGLDFTFLGLAGLGEIYRDLSGGTAYDLRISGGYKGTNINIRNAIYSDFESEEARFDGAARKSQTELTLARNFKSFLGNLGLRFRFDHERFKSNPDNTEFDFSQSYSNKGTASHPW